MIPIANAERTCGGCTACCDGWLTGNILGHELAPGLPCHFRGAGGCSIYDGSDEFQKEILEKSTRGEPLLPGLNPGGGGPCKLMPLDPAIADAASAPQPVTATPSQSAGATLSRSSGG